MDSIKIDSQARTTAAGFAYSNEDPANRPDHTPTNYSYVDSALEARRSFLELEVKNAEAEKSTDAEPIIADLESVLKAQQRRKPSEFEPSVFVSVPKAPFEPLFGEAMTVFVMLLLLSLVLAPIVGENHVLLIGTLSGSLVVACCRDRIFELVLDAMQQPQL